MTDPQQIITVTVQIPAWLWWKCATAAERARIPVAGFVAHAIREELDQVRLRNATGTQLDVVNDELNAIRAARRHEKQSASEKPTDPTREGTAA